MKKTGFTSCMMMCSLLAVTADPASAQPEPSPVRVSWELSFEPTPPMRIQIQTDGGPREYWYMLYTVTNDTRKDVNFHPEIVRVNEIETELPADRVASQPQKAPHRTVDPAIVGLHQKIFRQIKNLHKRTHPFLVQPVDAIGKLLQGKDNARTSVAVFPALDPRASKFTVYVTGLSGERITKPNPLYDAKTPPGAEGHSSTGTTGQLKENPRFFLLRKTLAIPYTLPGDAKTRKTAQPVLGRMTWVMR